ncbi:MAG: PAS domain S-box protein [Flavobacterium sp.]
MKDVSQKLTKRLGLFLIFILGFLYLCYIWDKSNNEQDEAALNIGKTIVATLPLNDLEKLDVRIEDLKKPEYHRIKSILQKTTETNKNTKFAFFNAKFSYLYTEKNGILLLLCDSELPGSKDYMPPGTYSVNPDPVYFEPIKTGAPEVKYTKHKIWGNWISVIIPITKPATNKTIAAFGLDFDPISWYKPIIYRMLQSMLLVALATILFLFFFKIKNRNNLLKQKIEDYENTDRELKKSEAKLSKILEATQDVFYKAALDGSILEVSKSVENFTEYKTEELIGTDVGNLYADKKDREILLGILKEKGKVRDYEIKMKFKNGDVKYVLLNSTIIFDQNRKPLHIEGAMKDITERRITEEKLIESEYLLRMLIENQPGCVKIVSREGLLELMNPPGLSIIEAKSFEQVKNRSVFDLITPEFKEAYINFHKDIIAGNPGSLIFQMRTLKGNLKWMETHAVPLKHNDKIVHLAHTNEITERKKTEDLLKENEQFLRESQKIGHIGSYNFDMQKGIWLSSDVLDEIFGIDKDFEKTIAGWESIIHPDWVKTMDEYLMNEVIGQKKGFDKEYKIIRKNDGATRWVRGMGRLHFDAEGKPGKLIGVIQDITRQKEFEEELSLAKYKAEESERLKSAFLANMSHEIRTPMNGILGFTELLKESTLSGEKQTEYIEIIRKSGNRMLNIINDIINISKIESGLMRANFVSTNVNEQIEYIYSFFKHEAFSKGIELSYSSELSFDKAFINSDKEKIGNILTNLIKNAIKFTHKGGIEFGYCLKINGDSESDKALEFYVKDTGTGIDDSQIDIVFERFRQTNESISRNHEGAGLGLAITKSFVEMLGGEIWVESQLGKGSTFYFTLPYNHNDIKTEIAPVNETVTEINTITNLKVLIAEDDEISAKLLNLSVKNISNTILRARNGEEAVELAQNNPDIDLILMDIQMPKMDGYQAAATIRQFNPDVIIVAQSAFAFSEDVEKALNAGCTSHISKPVKKAELLKLANKYFKDKKTA